MKMRRMLQQQQSIHTRHPNLLDVLFALWLTTKFLFVYLYCGQPSTRDHHCYTDIIRRSLSAIGCDIFLSGIHITTSTFILFCTLCWQVVPFPSCCVCTLATGFTQNDFLGRRRKTKTLTIILFCTLCWKVVPFPYYGAHCPCWSKKNIHLLDCFPF